MSRRCACSVAILIGLVCALASAAYALVPVEPILPDRLLSQSPDGVHASLGAGAPLPASLATRAEGRLADLTQSLGGRWSALDWNPVTLTPRLITGSGLAMNATVRNDTDAETLARAFVDRTTMLWDLPAAQLALENVGQGLGKRSVHFFQQYEQLPVIGSRLTVTMTETGRIFAFGGDLWPHLSAPTQPVLTEDDAHARVLDELQLYGAAPLDLGPRDRVETDIFGILPVSATEGRLVYRIETFFHQPLGSWLIDIDARSGEILQIQNVLRALDFTGTVTGDVEHPGWCFGNAPWPMSCMFVEVPVAGIDTTDANGCFSIPYEGTEPDSATLMLYGPYVDVNNESGPDAALPLQLTPGEPAEIYWDDACSQIDERDVFHHVNDVHEFVKSLDPNWHTLDFPLPANVSLPASCNAYWDGSSINFYHEAGNCANTGRLGDVINHEYGHGITDFFYAADPPSDVHEANSDVVGNYLHNESKMGRGFYLDDCENGIRDSNNDLRWPEDLTGEGHHDGQILAGFHWDARENMMLSLGPVEGHLRASQVWHFSRVLGLPMIQPEQVWWTFIADDDDGNMDNGTPNFADLCAAAEHHGFSCPQTFANVVIHHQAFRYIPSPNGEPMSVLAQIYSFDGAMNPDSLLVYYRVQGDPDFAAVLLQPAGGESLYVAEIPAYPVETMIEYYLFAADELHNSLTDPRCAPADLHVAMVVTAYEAFEGENGWTVGAAGDDATQGIWEICDPAVARIGPNVVQPGDDATPDPGVLCFITGQYTEGYPWYSDADGRTTLISPVYDLTGCLSVRVLFHRWFQAVNSTNGRLDVDVRNNGGLWTNVHRISGFQNPAAWTPVEIDISHTFIQPLGQIQLRFVIFGFDQPSIEEAGLDEFVLLASGGQAVDDPGLTPVPLQLSLTSGNPCVRSAATIRFGLPSAGHVDLQVLDIAGRVVHELHSGALTAGLHDMTWNGRDDDGRSIGSGVYFVRLTTPVGNRTERLLIAR